MTTTPDLKPQIPAIPPLCRQHTVTRLPLLPEYDPAQPQLRLLVAGPDNATTQSLRGYFGFKAALESILDAEVLLIQEGSDYTAWPHFPELVKYGKVLYGNPPA